MRDTIIPSGRKRELHPMPAGLSGMIASAARKALFVRLETIETGNIVIHEGQSFTSFGTRKSGEPLKAAIVVHDKSFYTDIAFGGSIGAAESYVAGSWSTDDLTKLIRIIILNRHVLAGIEGGKARLSVPFHRLLHLLRKNTVTGSRKNIAAHYDLGNEFYSLFLDESMTYSCGIFMNRNSSLHDASIAKYDRICRKLLLCGDDHVLEIGGGWGGFAIHAARHYGCRVTATTISKEQYEYARKQVYQEGLGGRIKIIMEDYRDLNGLYDKLVSIEMIEAVGHHYLEEYFRCCGRLLKQDGMMMLQAITISDQEYENHKNSVDVIKRHIFPGSCIPSITAMIKAVTEATDMRLFHHEDITPHYVRTLNEWRKRFFDRINDVRRLGYSEEFIRMWEYYLSYCEAGFTERYIGDVQMLFTKPRSRRPSIIPEIEKTMPHVP